MRGKGGGEGGARRFFRGLLRCGGRKGSGSAGGGLALGLGNKKGFDERTPLPSSARFQHIY